MTVRHDVSQIGEVEEALRRSEAKYREIFENIQDIFFQTNDQGLIVEVSPSVERYGYTREELIGMPAARVYEDPSKRITLLQLLEDGDITDREVRLRARDGRVLDLSISAHMLRGPDGSPAGMEGCLRDISDRKRAEEALRRSERELAIRNKIADIFLTVPDEEMYGEALQVILEALESRHGIFGYIDENGVLVCPSMTWDIWEQCQVPDKKTVFPPEEWGGIWSRALREKKTFCLDGPGRVPEGHIPIANSLAVPIIYRKRVIGLLNVANKETGYDEDDRRLLETIAGHIAPILRARLQRDRQERRRRRAQEALRSRTHELAERVKELNCLYGISTLVQRTDISLEEMLQGTVDLIPSSWRYPELTCARITLEGRQFRTEGFRETAWRQTSDVVVNGERLGAVEVCYLEERPESDEGPFLKEERGLINAIAERLGRVIEHRQAQEALREHRDRLEELVAERTAELTQTNERLLREAEERRRAEAMTRAQRDLAMALGATSDLQDALCSCLQAAISVSGMDCGGVYLVDRASGALSMACHEGLSAGFVESVSHYSPDSANARLVGAGKPAYAVHQEIGVPLDQNELAEGLRATAILPVHHDGQVIACLNVASHLLDEVPAASRDALEAIAAQIGSSIARVRALEALRQSEERFSTTFRAAPLGIVITSIRDRRFIDVNDSCLQLVGYSREEVIGRTALELGLWVEPDDRQWVMQMIQEGEVVREFVTTLRRKTGETIDILCSFARIELDGEPCLLGMSRDVTERRRAEAALRESEECFRQVLEVSSDLICKVDLASGTCDYVSPAVLPLTGFTQEEFAALGLRGYGHRFHPDDRPQYKQRINDFLRQGSDLGAARRHEFRWQCKDGQYRWFSDSIALVRGEDGQPLALVVNAHDTTERRQAEEALRESEERFRQVLEVSSDLVYRLNLESGTFDYVSPSVLSLTGFTPQEVIEMGARGIYHRVHPEDWQHYKRGLEEPLARRSDARRALTMEFRWQCKDGEYRWFTDGRAIVRGDDGRPLAVVGTIRDTTERRQAEEVLRREMEVLQTILDNIPVMVAFLDGEGHHQWVNRCWQSTLGWSAQEASETDVLAEFYPDPEYRKYVTDFIASAVGAWGDFRMRARDGRVLDTSWANVPLSDGSNIGIGIDVTERRQAEEQARQLQAEQVRANELRRMVRILEQMAATLGHELRNPLGVISNSVYFLANQAQLDGPKAQKHVLIIGREVAGAKRVIDDILEFAHVPQLLPAAASINAVVDSALTRSQIPANIRVLRRLAVDLPPVVCDEERLERAFIDIIANAVQAMPHGGRFGVNTCQSGDDIRVVFSDSGEGIAPENLDKVFEPMFTTKLRGIGLGLTVVRRTVEQHGGEISVRSRPGRGTVFTVVLPRDCRPFDAESGRVA